MSVSDLFSVSVLLTPEQLRQGLTFQPISVQLAVYAMLELRDIIKAYPRSPFIPATEEEKAQIKARLKELSVI